MSLINENEIGQVLDAVARPEAARVRAVLDKALLLKGLDLAEVALLATVEEPGLLAELFAAARRVKDEIYGRRLVLFAPLYISNLCDNECLYCAFRARNTALRRQALSQEAIAGEVRLLINQGHKRVLLVAGESYPGDGFSYILKSIETVYRVKEGHGEIRRVNVNIAPLSEPEFKQLKTAGIGTYQLFQETYHRATYQAVHRGGHKADYAWRLSAPDRAMRAGLDDLGIGVLLGLADWRFELLAMMQHVRHLERQFGVGPHTISVPRLEPASGSEMASHPPQPVSDAEFRKVVAILRLAVPYTGIIMSTREHPALRRETLALGVSQISAGSRTNPGGYGAGELEDRSQFSLGDHRTLDEVVRDVAELGYIPSFCTGCYRLGRTGADFMELARPGEIKHHCDPNALSTFQEYLLDYASESTRAVGVTLIDRVLAGMEPSARALSERLLAQVNVGQRDVFC